jgi:hypothetical protein
MTEAEFLKIVTGKVNPRWACWWVSQGLNIDIDWDAYFASLWEEMRTDCEDRPAPQKPEGLYSLWLSPLMYEWAASTGKPCGKCRVCRWHPLDSVGWHSQMGTPDTSQQDFDAWLRKKVGLT